MKNSKERFWSKVTKGPDCWEWTAGKVTGGYGRFGYGGKPRMAHRISWELLIGKIPVGLQIDHLCRNRTCVNPDHLEPVTRKENIRRGFSPTAINGRKTHCNNGHEFKGENIYRKNEISRDCRKCRKESVLRHREKMKLL